MVRFRTRSLRLLTSLLAVAFLLSPSADAQRKKPAKKKPAAAAKHKPANKAAPPAASQPAAPAEPAAPEPEPEPEPMPQEKGHTRKPSRPGGRGFARRGQRRVEKEKARDEDGPSHRRADRARRFSTSPCLPGRRSQFLPDYDLGGAPAVAIEVGIYPIRTSSGSITAGVTGSFENAVFDWHDLPRAQPGQEGTHATSANAYAIGLRGNYNFGTTRSASASNTARRTTRSILLRPTRTTRRCPTSRTASSARASTRASAFRATSRSSQTSATCTCSRRGRLCPQTISADRSPRRAAST